MSDMFRNYPHGCGIPWVDEADTLGLIKRVNEYRINGNLPPESKAGLAMKNTNRGNVTGGKVYDRETGLFIEK